MMQRKFASNPKDGIQNSEFRSQNGNQKFKKQGNSCYGGYPNGGLVRLRRVVLIAIKLRNFELNIQ